MHAHGVVKCLSWYPVSWLLLLGACHHDVTVVAPDIAQSQTYRLQFVNNETLPVPVLDDYYGVIWMRDAQLVPLDLGRASDGRIFEDRSGNGPSGGNTRDSSAVADRVSDVRVFELRRSPTIIFADSSIVDVVRHDDTLFIQRVASVPRFAYVDTGFFFQGILVVRIHKWRGVIGGPAPPVIGIMTYAVNAR